MREHLKNYIDSSKTPEVRGLRILLEYFYATEIFKSVYSGGVKVISVFGSARTRPNKKDYRLACRLGALLYRSGFAVVTGASRGIMQAANQGVADEISREIVREKKADSPDEARRTALYRKRLSCHSVGLSIALPRESESNPFVGVLAPFHYFMVRKFFFATLSRGFVACEGGWGTRDELYEILTLVQTGKAPVMPIIYLSSDPRSLQEDISCTLRKKYISPEDLVLIDFVKTPEQAVKIIEKFYRCVKEVEYDRQGAIRVVLKKSISAPAREKVEFLLSQEGKKIRIQWKKSKELFLESYPLASYGTLRRVVDVMNQGS